MIITIAFTPVLESKEILIISSPWTGVASLLTKLTLNNFSSCLWLEGLVFFFKSTLYYCIFGLLILYICILNAWIFHIKPKINKIIIIIIHRTYYSHNNANSYLIIQSNSYTHHCWIIIKLSLHLVSIRNHFIILINK